MFRFLFLLFLVVPLVELYFLIQIGGVIGAGWTLILVLATAAIGAYLVKLQGVQTLMRAQSHMAQGQVPTQEMVEGMFLAVSGFMLLLPGFVTDTMGFLLLIPTLRQRLIERMLKHQRFAFSSRSSSRHQQGDIIEGEVVDEPDPNRHLR